jgi:hypothetical protein
VDLAWGVRLGLIFECNSKHRRLVAKEAGVNALPELVCEKGYKGGAAQGCVLMADEKSNLGRAAKDCGAPDLEAEKSRPDFNDLIQRPAGEREDISGRLF